MRVIRTGGRDPLRNLAVEELLFGRAPSEGPALFLYRNAPAVVYGKNQNPWRELDVDEARRTGTGLVRRISGGGAVFHDPGNLNFSLVLPRGGYHVERQFEWIVEALRRCGVAAERDGRTSLSARGFKFSGSAFALRGRSAMHHGTLLWGSDLERMERLLRPPAGRFDGHGVRSIPAKVANLSTLYPGLRMEDLEGALIEEAVRVYGGPAVEVGDGAIGPWPWQEIAARRGTREWLFGETPAFTYRPPPDDGRGGVCIRVEHGRVTGVTSGDGAPDDPAVGRLLCGRWFDVCEVRAALRRTSSR